jgi:hypothetical protein
MSSRIFVHVLRLALGRCGLQPVPTFHCRNAPPSSRAPASMVVTSASSFTRASARKELICQRRISHDRSLLKAGQIPNGRAKSEVVHDATLRCVSTPSTPSSRQFGLAAPPTHHRGGRPRATFAAFAPPHVSNNSNSPAVAPFRRTCICANVPECTQLTYAGGICPALQRST